MTVRIEFGKLVRDRVPEIARADGWRPLIETLTRDSLTEALKVKLVEETSEVLAAHDKEQLAVELADVMEVVRALAHQWGIDPQHLEEVRLSRAQTRGAFHEGVFLSAIER